jgi:hypothetical protein
MEELRAFLPPMACCLQAFGERVDFTERPTCAARGQLDGSWKLRFGGLPEAMPGTVLGGTKSHGILSKAGLQGQFNKGSGTGRD